MNILLKHGYLFGSRTVRMTAMLAKGRPWYMTLAMLLLLAEGALIGFGILLMTYPFAAASGGEEAIRAILDDPDFRWKVALCFGGAVVAFFAGSLAVVAAMSLTVATGRFTARKVGAEIMQVVQSNDVIRMATVERPLIKSGGMEFAMRRSLRTLIRGSFLIPRMVSFALTGIVSFAAIFVLDVWFGLLSLLALGICAVPIYMMNRGVLKRVPEMESSMRRSMAQLSNLFGGNGSSADPFAAEGDLDRSFKLQGYLMTVRYRAGVIKALFLSVCLLVIGLVIIFFEVTNAGSLVALIVALKICSGSLQGIVRMSTGVSRTLRDVTPALYASSPPEIETVACPVWPLRVNAQDGDLEVNSGDLVIADARRVSSPLALSMIASRVMDRNGDFVDFACMEECKGHLCITGGSGSHAEVQIASAGEEAALVAKSGAVVLSSKVDPSSLVADQEQEIELELDLG